MNSPQASTAAPEDERSSSARPRFRVLQAFPWPAFGLLTAMWAGLGVIAFDDISHGRLLAPIPGLFTALSLLLAAIAIRSFLFSRSLRSHPLVGSGEARIGGQATLGRGAQQTRGHLFLTREAIVFSGPSGQTVQLPLKGLVLMKRDLKRDPLSSAYHLLAPGTGREMWLTPRFQARWEMLIRQAAARQAQEPRGGRQPR